MLQPVGSPAREQNSAMEVPRIVKKEGPLERKVFSTDLYTAPPPSNTPFVYLPGVAG